MLTELLLSGFVKLVREVLTTVLPTDPPPDMSAAGVVIPLYSFFDAWLPVHESIELGVLSIQVLGVLGAGWVLLWVLRKLPFLHIG